MGLEFHVPEYGIQRAIEAVQKTSANFALFKVIGMDGKPCYIMSAYHGQVLAESERQICSSDDKEHYFIVWDHGRPLEIEYDPKSQTVVIDACPKSKAAWNGYLHRNRKSRRA